MTTQFVHAKGSLFVLIGLLLVAAVNFPRYGHTTPVRERTPQVRDAIVASTGVNSANDVTETHLAAITSLDLSRKSLTSLRADDFHGLTALQSLDLNYNQLATLPPGIFDQTTALRTLNLGDAQYRAGNQLSGLPPGLFDNNTALQTLYLAHNQLSTLPSSIFDNNTALTILHLSYNQLSTLPSGLFDKNTALFWLHLHDNQLSTLPSGLFEKNTELRSLYLNSNQLTTLPSGIFDNNTELRSASLSHNQLSTLPPGLFDKNPALDAALLQHNQLTTLPSGLFANNSTLTTVYLQNNQLSSLPAGIFSGLSSLARLSLGYNQLASLADGIFSGLSSLTELNLSSNQLSSLPAGIFSGLSSLTELNLSSNQLSSLPAGIFSGLSSLAELHLGYNQLASLADGIFSGLSSLTTLQMHGNPIQLPIMVLLEPLGATQFKATVPTGAPFTIVLPISVTNGSMDGGGTTITIPAGSLESAPFTVTPTPGTSAAVAVEFGALPSLPSGHNGYSLVTPNRVPVFAEGATTTRWVMEGTWTGVDIGSAVSATDANGDPLTYTLTGPDAASFGIAGTTGQLKTVAVLDYETKHTYTVTVTASDGSLTASNTVTISVTDVDPEPLTPGGPGTVQLFYFLPNDRPYRPEVVAAMKTGIVELQTFFAEQMNAQGHGRKTFQIERDGQGHPIVHRVDGDYPASGYSGGYTEGEVGRAYDTSENVTLIVMDVSAAPTFGLGSGRKQSGWAIVYRGWDWFVAIHELGHAFGLNHDFRDNAYIMSFGPAARSSARLSACAAEFLSVHPYFNPNIPLENEPYPTFELVSPTTYPAGAASVPIRLRVRDAEGVHQVILLVNPKRSLAGGTPEVKACRRLAGETDTVVEFNYDGRTPSDQGSPYTSLSDPTRHKIYFQVVDSEGNNRGNLAFRIFTLEETEILPVGQRTAQVREAILGVVRLDDPNVSSYAEIDETHLAGITALYLNDIGITSLKAGDFDGLTGLEELRLWGNQLTSLPEGAFSGLSSLATLRFSLNQLTSLPPGLFEGLSALTDLRMTGNQLTTLPDSIFDGLAGLSRLALGSNSVAPLPLSVSLERVAEGQFKAVAPTGAPFDLVLPLIVANGSINGGSTTITIPAGSVESDPLAVTRTPGATYRTSADIGTLPGLPSNHSGYTLRKSADLPVVFTELGGTVFPPVCNRTPQVRAEIVAKSPVSACGDVTKAHLAGITVLGLGGKGISTLRVGDFAGLTALERLWLFENQLSSLPEEVFGGLTALRILDLGSRNYPATGNQLTSLPEDVFDGLTKLEGLDLNGNRLSSLPEELFDELTALTDLRLGRNRLGGLPADVFDGLTALTTLWLGTNQLSSLPEEVFDGLTRLTDLRLQDNQLSSLPQEVFAGLTGLERLNLQNNQLSSLPEGVLAGLATLEELYLVGNTIDPLPVEISLEKVSEGQFKARVSTGAPFAMDLSVTVINGTISGSASARVRVAAGSMESDAVTVVRTEGTTGAVNVDLGILPGRPGGHGGYSLVKGGTLPLEVISGTTGGQASADFNGDGRVDFVDFFLFADAFDSSAQAKLLALAQEMLGLPEGSQLYPNAPNPFNSETVISWLLMRPGPAQLEVFAMTGQRLAVLQQGPQQAGLHRLHWDGRDDAGRPLASGIYLYRLVTDEGVSTRKLTLLR